MLNIVHDCLNYRQLVKIIAARNRCTSDLTQNIQADNVQRSNNGGVFKVQSYCAESRGLKTIDVSSHSVENGNTGK